MTYHIGADFLVCNQDEFKPKSMIEQTGTTTYVVPSEWRKFCVLAKRTSVHLYRDWVRNFINKICYR